MPVVNGKEFPYTKKGMAAAKAEKSKPARPNSMSDNVKNMKANNVSPGSVNDYIKKTFAGDVTYSGKKPRPGDTAEKNRMMKKDALKAELAKRKQKADAPKKRRAGE
jgi:hypothetical protein